MQLIAHRWRPAPAIDPVELAMKERTLEGVGTRLAELRQARRLWQEELAD